jgi:hypothetical protein
MKKYFELAKVPIIISAAVTLLRFILEKLSANSRDAQAMMDSGGAPNVISFIVGVAWLPAIFGVYFALKLRYEPHRYRALSKTLLAYGISSRLIVIAVMLIASFAALGTHYDIGTMPGAIGFPPPPNEPWFKPVVGTNLWHHTILTFLPQLIIWALIWTQALGMAAGAITFLIKGRAAGAQAKARTAH